MTLTVCDTGAGMSDEILQHVFEPFFTTKDEGKGSGLGLPSVYGFMKQSRGHIDIQSEVGRGTSIVLYFPTAATLRPDPQPAAEEGKLPLGDGEHILVVEDESGVRSHAVRQLRGLGYRVTEAASGTEAMPMLRDDPTIDLLFTDVVMPGGMNGRQLVAAAHAIRPGLKVLYTSGYTEDVMLQRGRLDVGVELLTKPYRRETLARKVHQVLTTN